VARWNGGEATELSKRRDLGAASESERSGVGVVRMVEMVRA
jgi:hypothetical protein